MDVRTVGNGALLSYRALFTWLNPLGYLSSRVVRPVGMAVAFTALSAYYGSGAGRMIVGASMLAGTGSVVYGMALAVGNERSFGTLAMWLASPQNKVAAACQRALPHLADGFVGGVFTYLVCCLLYWSTPMPVPSFVLLLALGVLATFGLGMVLSGLALIVKDLFVGPNVAELVLMVLSGTLIARDRLPGALRPLTEVVPLSHLMGMVGAPVPTVRWSVPAIATEGAVTLAWFLIGVLLVSGVTRRAVRSAQLS
jgi:ABC-2 type transport system permease protein